MPTWPGTPATPGSWIDLRKPYRGPQVKTCNRCGATGLFWQKCDGAWRLHAFDLEEGDYELHVCPPAESGLGDRASTRDAMSAPDEQKPRASDGGGS